jgi:hypothetical protein
MVYFVIPRYEESHQVYIMRFLVPRNDKLGGFTLCEKI